MKNFLSLSRASQLQHHHNITRRIKVQLQGYINLIDITDGDCFCFDSTESASFILGEGIEIEGIGANGKKLGPVQNAWGATTGYFKAKATKDTTIAYFINQIDVFEQNPYTVYNQKVVLQDWEGTLNTVVDVKNVEAGDITQTADVLYTAALQVTVSFDSDSPDLSANVDGESQEGLSKKDSVTGRYVEFSTYPEVPDNMEAKKYTSQAKVTVKIDKKPPFYPNTIIDALEPNTIYSAANTNPDNNPDNNPDGDDPDGLSAGAIAGIVIACVVVVGVVVFCVVWFVVLKKSCGKGSKSPDADA